MRYDSSHKQQTREAILKEAAAVIREAGPDGIGIKSIMAKVGLTQGGFYAHFQSKDDLVAQAIAKMFEERRSRMEQTLGRTANEDDLGAFIDNYLSNSHRNNVRAGCPLPALSSDVARLPGPAKERYVEGFKELVERLQEHMTSSKRDVREEAARSAVMEMMGALALSRATADDAEAQAILDTARQAVKQRLGLPTNT